MRPWTIRIAVLAGNDAIARLTDRLALALCPDPAHQGTCQNPWQITAAPFGDLGEPERSAKVDMVEDLNEQRDQERRHGSPRRLDEPTEPQLGVTIKRSLESFATSGMIGRCV